MKRNPNLAKLQAGYLFPEINRRKQKVIAENPQEKIISLGIGNTTEPLTKHITENLEKATQNMCTKEGYSGYGDEQGFIELRQKIADVLYKGMVSPDEVFVSDGAKCDIGRIQVMFGSDIKIAVQDPAYPVYVDGSVIIGATGPYNSEKEQFENIKYLKCSPENDFFPDLSQIDEIDVIYFCSPNNPTGAAATKSQLKKLIDFAKSKKAIIVFDSAYSAYIQDPNLPRSIFEIDGAKEVAIEGSSFSKPIGFTGVRLGWTVCPKELKYNDGTPVIKDWNRINTTIFNGASNIVQPGGLAALDPKGLNEMQQTIQFYMENAQIIKSTLDKIGIKTYGGDNAPYIWAEFPGRKSWDVFEEILTKTFVVTTPGSGFGQGGEGFIRFSAFGHREDITEAVERLKNLPIF